MMTPDEVMLTRFTHRHVVAWAYNYGCRIYSDSRKRNTRLDKSVVFRKRNLDTSLHDSNNI